MQGASVSVTALSLITCTAGAGVLSFPWAVARTGVLPLVLLLLLFSLLSAFCNLVLADFAFRHRRALSSRTFDNLIFLVLGESHYLSVAAQVIVGLVGALTGFFCVAADIGVPVLGHLCGAAPSPLCAALATRGGVVLLFALLVVLPLASCARIHHLRLPSALAVAAILFVVGLVVVRGLQRQPLPPLPLAVPSAQGLLLAAPIAIYALGNHVQSVSIFLDGAQVAMPRYHVAILACYAFIFCLYLATGVCGFLAFGSGVAGNVLTAFPLGDAPADAAKALMALHVALVIAVDAIPLRRSLALMYSRCARHGLAARAPARGAGVGVGAAEAWEALLAEAAAAQAQEEALPTVCGTPCSLGILAQTAGLLGLSGGLAVLFPQVNLVFGLLGSTLSVTCVFGYPALMLLRRAEEVERGDAGGEARLGLLLNSSPLLAEQELQGGGKGAEGGGQGGQGGHGEWLGYIPSDPFWLRVQGWGLLGISVLVAVTCTAEYIAQSFL